MKTTSKIITMEIAKNIKGKLNNRCHLNSFKHKKEFGSEIYVGLFVEVFSNHIVAIKHFFNVHNNVIVDTSIGTKNGLYFGKKVTKKYKSSNEMFDSELWATLYSEKRIENFQDLKEICEKYQLQKLN